MMGATAFLFLATLVLRESFQSLNECRLVADIAFLIDKSGSISLPVGAQALNHISESNRNLSLANERINIIKDYISKMTDILPLHKNKTRVIAVTFNAKSINDRGGNTIILNNFTMRSSYDREKFKKVLNSITYYETDKNTGTFFGPAFRKVMKPFQATLPSRKNVTKIIIVFTDGLPTPDDDVSETIPQLRAMTPPYNIITFAVGDYQEEKLIQLTGDKNLIFKALRYEEIPQYLERFTDKICTVKCELTEWTSWGDCLPVVDNASNGRQLWRRRVIKAPLQGAESCYPLEKETTCPLPASKGVTREDNEAPLAEKKVKNNLPLQIGLGVLGLAALLSAAAGCTYFFRSNYKKKKEKLFNDDETMYMDSPNPMYEDPLVSEYNVISSDI
jgi:hypothetical protein